MDHLHPDAGIAFATVPDGEKLTAECFGGRGGLGALAAPRLPACDDRIEVMTKLRPPPIRGCCRTLTTSFGVVADRRHHQLPRHRHQHQHQHLR